MGKESVNLFEKESEPAFSPEEIVSVFSRLSGATEFEDIRRLEDKEGIYLWEVSAPTEEGTVKYTYTRKGTRDDCRTMFTNIKAFYFNRAGTPLRKGTPAKFIKGEWEITE